MNRTVLTLLMLAGLAACTPPHGQEMATPGAEFRAAEALPDLSAEVAWNQRVAFPVSAVPVSTVKLNGVPVVWTRVGNEVVFDLPRPPDDPSRPLASTPGDYANRGTVKVEVIYSDPSIRPKVETWTPYGSVVTAEVNVLSVAGRCPEPGSTVLGMSVVNTSSASSLCFFTLHIAQRDTLAAIHTLEHSLNALAVSRNVYLSLDQSIGLNSLDPSCRQTEHHLDPLAQQYQLLQQASLKALVGVGATSPTGAGVTVAILGSGVNPASLGSPSQLQSGYNFVNPTQPPLEGFACDFDDDGKFDLVSHDTHIAATIHSLAPGASIVPLKTCNNLGECRSAYSVMALMSLMRPPYFGQVIVNMSNGSPLMDTTMLELLKRPPFDDPTQFLLLASAGNQRVSVPHYPASFAPGAVAPGSLGNVVSVGAFGQTSEGVYESALFNTARNFEVLAPGINVCTALASQFRCSSGAAYPDHLGLSGTSYATSVATAVVALYAQSRPGQNLRTLLMNSLVYDVQGSAFGRVRFVP